ncbi:MAG: GWxTD domain-containing protein [Lentimicrobiaceae bacterium]|nr:GWxTD domain-containing protein [Lentimicrobiaceae bacterium]
MKKIFLSAFLLCAIAFSASASTRSLGAYLSHATFNIPGNGPFLETYLEIIGNSITYKRNESGKFQGSIQVTMIVRQDSVIKDFRKYELLSPEVDDTTAVGLNFIDQQRFSLPNGNYLLDLSIADMNVDKKPVVVTYPIGIDFPADNYSISGIQLINSFTKTTEPNLLSKSGYDFVPYVDNFFPSDKNKLTFYTEIYNPLHKEGSEEKYLVSAFIESFETKRMLNEYVRIKKETSKPVIVLLSEFDISGLPSGNYNLVVSLRDKENKIVTQNAVFFQRSNPNVDSPALDITKVNFSNSFADRISNADTLREHIRSMMPVATQLEAIFIKSQLETAPLDVLKQFFLNFWMTRNEINPEKAWEDYKFEVKKVNAAYSTQVKKGYNTDMGRVYLQYGPPNTVTDVPFDVSSIDGNPSVPYQIWHYYSLNNNRERNRKFVFIASELRAKDYTLAHSDASGEIQNYNWQNQLVRQLGVGDTDRDVMRQDRGRSATYYNNPY